MASVTCVICGTVFKIDANGALYRKTCSMACKSQLIRGRAKPRCAREWDCKGCGKKFKLAPSQSHKQYCCLECYWSSTWEDAVCEHCGKNFKARRCYKRRNGGRYCDRVCWRAAVESVERSVRARGACERCGYKEEPGILQMHHKDRDTANNTLDNLELLCPNCHALEHFHTKDGYFGPFSATNKNSHRARARRLKENDFTSIQ